MVFVRGFEIVILRDDSYVHRFCPTSSLDPLFGTSAVRRVAADRQERQTRPAHKETIVISAQHELKTHDRRRARPTEEDRGKHLTRADSASLCFIRRMSWTLTDCDWRFSSSRTRTLALACSGVLSVCWVTGSTSTVIGFADTITPSTQHADPRTRPSHHSISYVSPTTTPTPQPTTPLTHAQTR